MAAAPELVALSPPRAVGRVAGTDVRASVSGPTQEAVRVPCTSKRAVTDMLELCGGFVQNLGDALPEEIRELAPRDSDIKVLEDQFDETIVDLATKHTQYPRKILECVIKIIKAKQEILKQYHPVVYPLDLKYDPDPVMLCNISGAQKSFLMLLSGQRSFCYHQR
nr:kinetochore-associated protein NSL1 homolog isoform X1 [Manis javanica]